nr:hypothetical protein CFP56_29137 [Quercus suber]
MGLNTMEELRRRDQIGDGFERRDQTDGVVGWGLHLGFTGDSSLCPSAWAWLYDPLRVVRKLLEESQETTDTYGMGCLSPNKQIRQKRVQESPI